MIRKGTQFTALLLTALVTGVFWGTWFTLTRSLESFPPNEFIHIGKTIIANVAIPMAIIMPASLVALLMATVQYYRYDKTSFYMGGLSFLFMAITLIITVGIEVPIDNQIKTWTAQTIPQNWINLRAFWNKYHTVRTFTSITSFILITWSVLRQTNKRIK
jgi:uncharacterized membrane protein